MRSTPRESTTRAPRAPLARLRRLTLGDLGPAERETMLDETYAIFGHYFTGHDRDTFQRIAMPTPATRVGLLQTRDGVTAGFASINIHQMTVEGRVHAAVSSSAFVSPAHRGGTLGAAFLLGEIVRFRVRHPRTPLWYLACVLGPTTYQRFARFYRRTYPNRRGEFPPEQQRLALAFLEARGLSAEGPAPWVVDLGAKPLRTAPITPQRELDPDIRYYRTVNPGYTEGRALVMWIPVDRTTLAEAVWGLSRDGSTEAISWLRRGRAAAAPPPR